LYAQACIRLHHPDGALQSLLRVIVLNSKHKAARRALAACLEDASGLALLSEQLPFAVDSAPALAFLAHVLKVSPRHAVCVCFQYDVCDALMCVCVF
jgi:hypothetical protein